MINLWRKEDKLLSTVSSTLQTFPMVPSNNSQQVGALGHVTKDLLLYIEAEVPPRPSEHGSTVHCTSLTKEPLHAWRAAVAQLQIPGTSHMPAVLAWFSQVDQKACAGWGRLQSPMERRQLSS